LIQKLKELGIQNLRLGLSNHEIFKQGHGTDGPWDDSSWQQMDAIVSDLSGGGLKVSLDLHHFGIERMFQVAAQPTDPQTDFVRDGINYSKSFYLHPKWPPYFADFAAEAYRRYHDKVLAFTLINEPETTNGFQSQMWNGGQPGWFSPEHMKFYIERGMQIGLAAVMARTRMEQLNRSLPESERRPLLFIQSEAAQYKRDDPQFSNYCRFMTLDMILGQRWLMTADLDSLATIPLNELDKRWSPSGSQPTLEWLIHRYVFKYSDVNRDFRRAFLVEHLRRLQLAHRQFAQQFPGLTMQSFTVLGIDYYAQNESSIAATKIREGNEAQRMAGQIAAQDSPGPSPKELDPQPENYAAEIRSGDRLGLYGNALAYWQRYRTMPLASTENGTAWWSDMTLWHEQQLLEEGLIQQRHHIPFLAHFAYPLMDVRGWENDRALSLEARFSDFDTNGFMNHDLETLPVLMPMLTEIRSLWGRVQ
jgi:beta-glucosidase/6-phospho-beta-glucosidase/beta-galactosidase